MKRFLVVLLGVCIGLVIGVIASYAFNSWYTTHYVRSDDDANTLVSLLIFVFLPVFGSTGGIVANRLYARHGA
jgi:NhaP-type Na+/H+ or K+/H+ antiporter